jgi:hypothetical protein
MAIGAAKNVFRVEIVLAVILPKTDRANLE